MPNLTSKQKMFFNHARSIARERISPIATRMEEDDEFPLDLASAYADLGWFGLLVPSEFGGMSGGAVEYALLMEAISRVSLAAAQLFENNGPIVALRLFGTAEQKERFFPPLMAGVGAFACSEAHAGSDVGSIATTAVREGDSYVLNGHKCYVGNGGYARIFAVVASVDPTLGAEGIRVFIVDASESPNVVVGKRETMMGLRGISLVDVAFNNVIVPTANLIPEEDGFRALEMLFEYGRPAAAAMSVGAATAALDYATKYALGRRQFGRSVFDFQGVSFPLADAAARIEAARELTYRAAQEVDIRGPRSAELAAMAKLFASDTAASATQEALLSAGAAGYMKSHPLERILRDAKALQILLGTVNIQRVVISRALARGRIGTPT